MELNLSPQLADTTVYEGVGGGYYSWTGPKFPVLAQAKVGAGKLVLQPRGFALPHYADANKIGYVVQGTCTVGLVPPNNTQEKVVIINEGDAIPVAKGTISWWFNGGDSDTTTIFLGESSQSYNPGQFDYFILTGALGFLGGFSTEFTSKIYGFNEADSIKLARSQTNALIPKLGPEINMPSQSNCNKGEHVINLNDCLITAENFPFLDKIGLSASLVRLKPNTIQEPSYSTDGSIRIIYVTKGSGRVQIVGLNGTRVLDSHVHKDQLLVVPNYFAVAQLANEDGLEFFCVTTSSRPVLGPLAGSTSTWVVLSTPVLQAALDVSPEFVKYFKSKNY